MHIKVTGQQNQEADNRRSMLLYFYVSQFWVSANDATHIKINKNVIKNRSNKIKATEEHKTQSCTVPTLSCTKNIRNKLFGQYFLQVQKHRLYHNVS